MKKNWEYKWECPTCGAEDVVGSLDELDNTFCTVCVLEVKRKIDSGEINMDEIRKKYGAED